jgi:O-antigen/teichoic acid export membrane protein
MGVIQRQSFKYTIVNLVGMGIGMFSTFFIYPHVTAAYGLFQWLMSAAILISPLASLGAHMVAVRFFPRFEDPERGHHGFVPLLLALWALGCALVLFLGVLAWPWISSQNGDDPLKERYLWAAFPVLVVYVFNLIFFQYSSNFKRIVVPSLLVDFSLKLVQPLLMVGVWWDWIGVDVAVYVLIGYQLLVLLSMIYYLRNVLGQWSLKTDWAHLTPPLRKELRAFVLGFGVFGQLALQVATRLDTFLVGSLSTMSNAGVYAIAVNVAAVIEIPIKGLYLASISSVSRYLNEANWKELGILYQKVSINLLVAGLLILGALVVSVDDIYALIANTDAVQEGKTVLMLIGAARLVEMSTGLNNYILYYSPYYRLSLMSQGVMAVLNAVLGVWLIPQYGIVGAAWPTLLSITGYNLINVAIVWKQYKLLPFTRSTGIVLIIGILALGITWMIPCTPWPLLSLILRSSAFGALFMVPVLYAGISPDLNDLVRKWIPLPW